ncbi:hypothetical protein GGI18_000381 [Coemansia linderi]|uniref:Uncharacterized protein n=1 Tax=Coemansia linderi TaxID=2663919 RepID=A0ACC1KNL1_9FUNG|nr:hypothetical protein GGI18_000381 [Coemansia linderi]
MSADSPVDDWESALDAAVAAEAGLLLSSPSSTALPPFINTTPSAPHTTATPADPPQQSVTPPQRQQQGRKHDRALANRAIWEQANSYEPYEPVSELGQTTYLPPIKVLQRTEQHKAGGICRSQKQGADQQEPRADTRTMSLTEKQRAYEEARRKIFGE